MLERTTKIVINERKIFCIGLNKTGTTSLSSVLTSLGYKLGNQRQGEQLLKEWAIRDFKGIIDFCKTADAFQDIPFSLDFTYEAVDIAFPNSKFILTVRDNKYEWFNSLIRFHSKLRGQLLGEEKLPTAKELKMAPYSYPGFMWDSMHLTLGIDESTLYDYKIYTDNYEQYNTRVKKYFKYRPNDLLILNISEDNAMEKLYDFIDKEYHGEKMPHLNSSKSNISMSDEINLKNLPLENEIMQKWNSNIDQPLVSICCITYNHEKFIAEALDSFLLQKTDFHFEIVIDDDCSTDNTTNIIKKYREKFPNIINANLRDVNVGASKNTLDCLTRSKGEYLALCEGDDYWINDHKLQYQIDKMKEYPNCNISFHPVKINNNLGISENDFLQKEIKNNPTFSIDDNNQLIRYRSNTSNKLFISENEIMKKRIFDMPTPSIIIKQKILSSIPKICFNSPHLDSIFQLYGLLDGGALYLDTPMAVYRMHPNGLSKSRKATKEYMYPFHMNFIKAYIAIYHDIYPRYKELSEEAFTQLTQGITGAAYYSLYEILEFFIMLDPYISNKNKEDFYKRTSKELTSMKKNKKTAFTSMEIDIYRDTALKLEKENFTLAYELMNIAHIARPSGPFIKQKLEYYKSKKHA